MVPIFNFDWQVLSFRGFKLTMSNTERTISQQMPLPLTVIGSVI